jgi:hypothetical protein
MCRWMKRSEESSGEGGGVSFPWLPTSNKVLNALFWLVVGLLGMWLLFHLLQILKLVLSHA